MTKIISNLDGYNPKYGLCQYRCHDKKWIETKNCCYGSPEDNDFYSCDGMEYLPACDSESEGIILYTECAR